MSFELSSRELLCVYDLVVAHGEEKMASLKERIRTRLEEALAQQDKAKFEAWEAATKKKLKEHEELDESLPKVPDKLVEVAVASTRLSTPNEHLQEATVWPKKRNRRKKG